MMLPLFAFVWPYVVMSTAAAAGLYGPVGLLWAWAAVNTELP